MLLFKNSYVLFLGQAITKYDFYFGAIIERPCTKEQLYALA